MVWELDLPRPQASSEEGKALNAQSTRSWFPSSAPLSIIPWLSRISSPTPDPHPVPAPILIVRKRPCTLRHWEKRSHQFEILSSQAVSTGPPPTRFPLPPRLQQMGGHARKGRHFEEKHSSRFQTFSQQHLKQSRKIRNPSNILMGRWSEPWFYIQPKILIV